jgi:hypothetical protein
MGLYCSGQVHVFKD